MPSSRKRGGKKAHNKRVQNRNKRIQDLKNKQSKYQQEMFEKMMKEYEAQLEMEKNKEEGLNVDQIDGLDGPEL
jgi:hypothetical protein